MSDPLVSLLERLIRFATPNPEGDEVALATLLEGELAARGADSVHVVQVPRGGKLGAYVVAKWGTPRLLVNAHLDTVPPSDGWSHDPYVARLSDGRLSGLGAADTKGAIAAVLSALEVERPKDVAVLFSGDEERTSQCIRAFMAGPHARGLTQAIVCEPTSLRAGVRHRGIMLLTAEASGPGGHSSRADQLPAPVAELAEVAVAWRRHGQRLRDVGPPGFTGLCVNIAQMSGGVAFNVIPAKASMVASVRPPPGTDVAALRTELFAMARAQAPSVQLMAPVQNPPFATRDLSSFARWLPQAVRTPTDLAFWTEAAGLADAGIDAVVFGPGDIAQAHGPDEWVPVAELHAARQTFVELFAESRRS